MTKNVESIEKPTELTEKELEKVAGGGYVAKVVGKTKKIVNQELEVTQKK